MEDERRNSLLLSRIRELRSAREEYVRLLDEHERHLQLEARHHQLLAEARPESHDAANWPPRLAQVASAPPVFGDHSMVAPEPQVTDLWQGSVGCKRRLPPASPGSDTGGWTDESPAPLRKCASEPWATPRSEATVCWAPQDTFSCSSPCGSDGAVAHVPKRRRRQRVGVSPLEAAAGTEMHLRTLQLMDEPQQNALEAAVSLLRCVDGSPAGIDAQSDRSNRVFTWNENMALLLCTILQEDRKNPFKAILQRLNRAGEQLDRPKRDRSSIRKRMHKMLQGRKLTEDWSVTRQACANLLANTLDCLDPASIDPALGRALWRAREVVCVLFPSLDPRVLPLQLTKTPSSGRAPES